MRDKIKQFDTGKLCGAKTGRGYNQSTATGLPFWIADPQPEDIRIEDIANHLARICRFGGALRTDIPHYSVAQHCCLVSDHLPDELKLEGLLHDAHEAYIGDMIKPVKMQVPAWKAVERRVELAVRMRFGLPAEITAAVKEQDWYAVATEHRDVQPHMEHVDWGDVPEPWPEYIEPWDVFRARSEFKWRFVALYHGCYDLQIGTPSTTGE